MSMEGETSCEWRETNQPETVSTKKESTSDAALPTSSFNTVLPDDIVEKVLSFLPVGNIIRAGSVCKRWHGVVHSGKHSWQSMPAQKPWYFMFTFSKSIKGFAYDLSFQKWHSFDFPCLDRSNWFVSSSHGLVCFMDYENRNRIFVCNPITRDWKQLPHPPDWNSPEYSALALSVNRSSLSYTIAIVKSKQLPGDFRRWEFAVQVYRSENRRWVPSVDEVLVGWRGGDESVICDGVLYCLVYSFSPHNEPRHGIVSLDLRSSPPPCPLMASIVPVPCPLTCGRLMNLRNRLVMVGGIGRSDKPDVITGVGIWELCEERWSEVSRMPQKLFQGFGELDDVFASSGVDDVVFIQSYGAPMLLIFEMGRKQWRWSVRCPVAKRFALQLFAGFCFEPRLESTL